jgi:hypothetical protein
MTEQANPQPPIGGYLRLDLNESQNVHWNAWPLYVIRAAAVTPAEGTDGNPPYPSWTAEIRVSGGWDGLMRALAQAVLDYDWVDPDQGRRDPVGRVTLLRYEGVANSILSDTGPDIGINPL